MNKLSIVAIAVVSLLFSCRGEASSSEGRPALADSIAYHLRHTDSASSAASTPADPHAQASAVTAGKLDPQQALRHAYPDFIASVSGNTITFTDGSTMEWDDGREKSFEQKLDNSDPQDMFTIKYDSRATEPEYLADGGRSRCEALFKKMYGTSAAAVQRNLVNVNWMGKNIRFTSVNGAADSLRRVAAELARHPELQKYLACSGTFYWRNVRGAKRLSSHSYGIAIDIAVPYSDYWLWRNPRAGETAKIKYSNRIPREIVEIFRRHGFIWGGAWYHFDTMHFEFRPEILAAASL